MARRPPPRYTARMPTLVLVMTGGALGAGARYGVGRALEGLLAQGWPWPTLAINVAGGFLMGLLAATLARGAAGENTRLALGVGVLGGFTTFSAFSLETVSLIARGQVTAALAYIAASVLGALAALYAGQALGTAL